MTLTNLVTDFNRFPSNGEELNVDKVNPAIRLYGRRFQSLLGTMRIHY